MTKVSRIVACAALCVAIPLGAAAGDAGAKDAGWKTVTEDGGKTTAKSRVTERVDEKGAAVPLVEYCVTTTAGVGFGACVEAMRDASRHAEIMSAKTADLIERVSDAECVLYYYYKGVAFVEDSDVVVTMTESENESNKTATFHLTAAPSRYPVKGVKRADFFNLTYGFRDLGDGTTEISIVSESSPAMKVPVWMIELAFPGAAVDTVHRFVKMAGRAS